VNGVPCDEWASFFGDPAQDPDGMHACVTTDGLLVQVNYTIGDLAVIVNYTDFGSVPQAPRWFDVPLGCTPNEPPTSLPAGLAEGFESGAIDDVWLPPLARYFSYVPGHIVVQSDIVRSGRYAARIDLHPGDVHANGGDGSATERDELDLPLLDCANRSLSYSWAFRTEPDFTTDGTRLVLGQWKQDSLFTGSPIFAMRLRKAELVLTIRSLANLSEPDTVLSLGVMPTGSWNTVSVNITYSPSPALGSLAVSLNNQQPLRFSGQTLYSGAGYVDWHLGMYRDARKEEWKLWLDDISVTEQTGDEGTLTPFHV
jgi:hypothetical protein